jgi:hypothetical protein
MRIFTLDTLERVTWTAIQFAAAAWIDVAATGEVTWRAVAYAAGLALCKAIVARHIGDPDSAATLPSPPDHAGPRVPPLPKD